MCILFHQCGGMPYMASHESRGFPDNDLWTHGSLSTCSLFVNSYSSEGRRPTLGVLQEMGEGSAAASLVSC